MTEALQHLAVAVVLPMAQVVGALTFGVVLLAGLGASILRLISRLSD